MTFLTNRRIAVLISVVVAIVATLVAVNRSMTHLSRDIERMFYDGVPLEREGYTQPSIDSQLKKHADATLGLATILVNYSELHDDAENVLRLRRELLDAESIGEKSLAFLMMSRAVYSLSQVASEVAMTEQDKEALSQYSSTINGAEAFIRDSAYNQTNTARWNERSAIARIICFFVPVREPEAFAT